jgi:hypothetical protein
MSLTSLSRFWLNQQSSIFEFDLFVVFSWSMNEKPSSHVVLCLNESPIRRQGFLLLLMVILQNHRLLQYCKSFNITSFWYKDDHLCLAFVYMRINFISLIIFVYIIRNVCDRCPIGASVKKTQPIYSRCKKSQLLNINWVFSLYESIKKLLCYILI